MMTKIKSFFKIKYLEFKLYQAKMKFDHFELTTVEYRQIFNDLTEKLKKIKNWLYGQHKNAYIHNMNERVKQQTSES